MEIFTPALVVAFLYSLVAGLYNYYRVKYIKDVGLSYFLLVVVLRTICTGFLLNVLLNKSLKSDVPIVFNYIAIVATTIACINVKDCWDDNYDIVANICSDDNQNCCFNRQNAPLISARQKDEFNYNHNVFVAVENGFLYAYLYILLFNHALYVI